MKMKNFKSGFTLIETLVAVSVLAFAFIGPLTLGYYSIKSDAAAKNQLTAFFLAQDAMEYIRNRRDTNFLQRPLIPWLSGMSQCIDNRPPPFNTTYCRVDTTQPQDPPSIAPPGYTNGAIATCSGAGCGLLYRPSDGLYNHLSGNNTIFIRTVQISDVALNPDEKKVKITISWTERTGTKSFTLEEHLFNWGGMP